MEEQPRRNVFGSSIEFILHSLEEQPRRIHIHLYVVYIRTSSTGSVFVTLVVYIRTSCAGSVFVTLLGERRRHRIIIIIPRTDTELTFVTASSLPLLKYMTDIDFH